jgi:hypothetical protein
VLENLQSTVIKLNLLNDKEQPVFRQVQLLGGVDMVRGMIVYDIHPKLKPFIFDPMVYGVVKVAVTALFSSKHALALYETCSRFVGVKSTGWKDVATFRQLLGVDGTKRYDDFAQLNSRVLKPALRQINRMSDLKVAMHMRTEPGTRKVSKIRFEVLTKDDFSLRRAVQLPLPGCNPLEALERIKPTLVAAGYIKG